MPEFRNCLNSFQQQEKLYYNQLFRERSIKSRLIVCKNMPLKLQDIFFIGILIENVQVSAENYSKVILIGHR